MVRMIGGFNFIGECCKLKFVYHNYLVRMIGSFRLRSHDAVII